MKSINGNSWASHITIKCEQKELKNDCYIKHLILHLKLTGYQVQWQFYGNSYMYILSQTTLKAFECHVDIDKVKMQFISA